MEKALKTMFSITLALLFLFSNHHPIKAHKYHQTLNPKPLAKEKVTHLQFFFHDIVSGKNPTAVRVAEGPATSTSATSFGAINVIDDPLTLGSSLESPRIGSAQGIYVLASQSGIALLMAQYYVFTAGEFNGSTLSILGRNAALTPVRELPIIGGTGKFRFARGYALAKTHFFNATSGDAIVNYNVYVYHSGSSY